MQFKDIQDKSKGFSFKKKFGPDTLEEYLKAIRGFAIV